ncbi:MAG: hypothetical protein KAI25_14200, partial [Hyphomicrobiaceae bacterium]|nr:hypothetical protein [Hyphomicrobiaceae bacterium]
ISTTTLILLAGLFILSSIYFLYLDDDEKITYSSGYGGVDPDNNILQKLSTTSCIPSSGYDFCYTNTYGAATATIHSTNWIGEQRYGYVDGANRWFYIDEVYVNVKYKGDKLYKSSSTSWISCSSSGCSATSISPGKVVLASAPSKVINPIQFSAWDKFTSTSGQYWYSYVQFGWLSSTPTYVIDCYDDSDVPEGYYCDKSGSWDTWTAKKDMCIGVDTPFVSNGYDLYCQSCDKATGYVSQSTLIEANSATCGYVCQAEDTQLITCTDGSTVTKSICESNEWIINNEYPEQSCPINWNNIDMILTSYLNQITTIIKGIFS